MNLIDKLKNIVKKPIDSHQIKVRNTRAANPEPGKKEIRKEPLTPPNPTVTYSDASIIFRER